MNTITEACRADREGSAALEHILRKKDCMSSAVPELGLKKLMVSAYWYIWWERRKIAKDENVQKPARTSQSILALSLNYFKASKQKMGIKRHGWIRPAEDYVKLNIDAAFFCGKFFRSCGSCHSKRPRYLPGGMLRHITACGRCSDGRGDGSPVGAFSRRGDWVQSD
jgi:hypothetical protein